MSCALCQASFDFGPSFMDEVLKALDEKEKEVELASSARCGAACHLPISDHTDIDVSRDVNGSNVVDKTPLVEEKCFNPILEKRSPPPLPCQPPRSVCLCDRNGLIIIITTTSSLPADGQYG